VKGLSATLNLERGSDSLANFKRRTSHDLQHLQQTGNSMILTVNGEAQVVVRDAAACPPLREQAARADREETVSALREGLGTSRLDAQNLLESPCRRSPGNSAFL
jgi:hypothetical protein